MLWVFFLLLRVYSWLAMIFSVYVSLFLFLSLALSFYYSAFTGFPIEYFLSTVFILGRVWMPVCVCGIWFDNYKTSQCHTTVSKLVENMKKIYLFRCWSGKLIRLKNEMPHKHQSTLQICTTYVHITHTHTYMHSHIWRWQCDFTMECEWKWMKFSDGALPQHIYACVRMCACECGSVYITRDGHSMEYTSAHRQRNQTDFDQELISSPFLDITTFSDLKPIGENKTNKIVNTYRISLNVDFWWNRRASLHFTLSKSFKLLFIIGGLDRCVCETWSMSSIAL